MAIVGNIVQHEPKFSKEYDGIIVKRNDPLNSGRLLVKVPELLGEATVWARAKFLQGKLTIIAIPPEGDIVRIKFNGSEEDCEWTGGSPKEGSVEDPDLLLIQDENGNRVEWQRKTGEIYAKSKGKITFESDTAIELKAPTIFLNGTTSIKNGASGVITALDAAVVSEGVVTQVE